MRPDDVSAKMLEAAKVKWLDFGGDWFLSNELAMRQAIAAAINVKERESRAKGASANGKSG